MTTLESSAQENMAEQKDIFFQDEHASSLAELMNALYQRECLALAESGPSQTSLLKRKLKHLPHHVYSAAQDLLASNAPIDVDIHNASYTAKQAAHCPGINQTNEQIQDFYTKSGKIGAVLPVLVKTMQGMHIEIDSLDRIDEQCDHIHANKHGWFTRNGISQAEQTSTLASNEAQFFALKLLKPSKAIWTAACCGHQWKHKGRAIPRALTMRELRLSFNIKW
ncbi:hypothetical protein [Opacimonas viscosa]|uniref:Uncharacterized protein n=1 Tax=Opacimonas viscosa TaxID=2961944 RepID=A0AA41WW97_9ALTE|nr:hypothetical protein [Opacimonas viscosa]MCP3427729.1 hypothetical protein [Opacimonas viscosa]